MKTESVARNDGWRKHGGWKKQLQLMFQIKIV